jgi:hypothetical protein
VSLLTPVGDLYLDYNTLLVRDLHKQQILLLVHKVLCHPNKLPQTFRQYFSINRNIHCHNSRIKQDIHIHSSKVPFGQRSIKIKAGTAWDALPHGIKERMSVGLFKYKLCNYLMAMM